MAAKDRLCKACGAVVKDKSKNIYCYPCIHIQERQEATKSAENFLTFRLRKARARSASKGFGYDLDIEYLKDVYTKQKGYCAISGLPMTYTYENPDLCISIDRIDNKIGYLKTNIRLVCYRVNIMRNELSEAMFTWWVKQIAK